VKSYNKHGSVSEEGHRNSYVSHQLQLRRIYRQRSRVENSNVLSTHLHLS
jgi:hypothetical protein